MRRIENHRYHPLGGTAHLGARISLQHRDGLLERVEKKAGGAAEGLEVSAELEGVTRVGDKLRVRS